MPLKESSATLAEIVADTIRTQLRDGVHRCGDKLAELTLSKELNISQNTARDALALLIQEGWLVKRPRYGITVRQFTSDSADELFTLWGTLEKLVMHWVMKTITNAEIAHVNRLVLVARDQAMYGDVRDMLNTRFEIHHFLLQIANKPQTSMILHQIYNQVWLLEVLRMDYAPRNAIHHRELLNGYDMVCRAMGERNLHGAQEALYFAIINDAKPFLPVVDLLNT
ncbi:MAG: GntR family transcriptional regulator [Anaerolineae bacterium]|jgi:DNA-binding GntR family transcriptional regulator|nr:GntR family transcriptional regulator [Anaerolineae bacterium]